MRMARTMQPGVHRRRAHVNLAVAFILEDALQQRAYELGQLSKRDR
jgi:hypothetical protein